MAAEQAAAVARESATLQAAEAKREDAAEQITELRLLVGQLRGQSEGRQAEAPLVNGISFKSTPRRRLAAKAGGVVPLDQLVMPATSP